MVVCTLFVFFNAAATVRMALESYCFWAVVCVHMLQVC